ncbi:MAG: hypothetical protein OXI54_13615 [Chloroflexota bacterium]|nr:hypothetical protein [Chloroflexota bacterium]
MERFGAAGPRLPAFVGGWYGEPMTTPISNDDIVTLFNNMAAMLEIKGDLG